MRVDRIPYIPRQVSRGGGTDNGPSLNFNLLNRSLKRKTETSYSIGTPRFYRCDPALTGVSPNANTEHSKTSIMSHIFKLRTAPTLCAPYLLTKFIDMESIESFWVSVGRYDGGSSRVRQNSEFFIRHTGKIQVAKSHFRIWDRDNLTCIFAMATRFVFTVYQSEIP
jgi:hypothetical protein